MEHSDLLRFFVTAVEAMGLRYFVAGSTATIFYGEPRLTIDIDIIVDLSEQRAAEFCRKFPSADFYVSEEAALDAIRRRSQFNIIHPGSGLKIDVIIPDASGFDELRFTRALRVRMPDDFDVTFVSPEDAIIKKLEYFREGGSEKHLRDIAGVLKSCREPIDTAYISSWAERMGVGDVWSKIQRRVIEDDGTR
jgi:hypothetical protein